MSVGKACDLTTPNQSLPEPSPPGRVMDGARLCVLNQDHVLCSLNTRLSWGFLHLDLVLLLLECSSIVVSGVTRRLNKEPACLEDGFFRKKRNG